MSSSGRVHTHVLCKIRLVEEYLCSRFVSFYPSNIDKLSLPDTSLSLSLSLFSTMLPQFRNQCFQLPLISTTWSSLQTRYTEEKKTLSLPIRFILSSIEQTYSTLDKNLLQPMFHPYQSYCKVLLFCYSKNIRI